jgi:hypothetical protein
MAAPSDVAAQKIPKFIRLIPAGSDIYCRVPGSSRPIKVLMCPWRVKKRSAYSEDQNTRISPLADAIRKPGDEFLHHFSASL